MNLKKMREKSKLTQMQVAELAELTVPQYSRYETGSRKIPSNKLPLLAKIFNCTVDELFED